jgi:hypothetical protein
VPKLEDDKTMFKEACETYLYRRQYILAPCPVKDFNGWQQFRVGKDSYLAAHPDLPVTEVHYEDRSFYLLGYIIDPYNPSYDNTRVMKTIIEKSITADDVFECIADKCGRFVLMIVVGTDFRIFSDACGLRQVFYYFDSRRSVWCSSQPHLIANHVDARVSDPIKSDLDRTPLFHSKEHWYPGTITLFDGIYHLTPNHYLDGNSGASVRYWPKKRLDPISMSECVPEVSKLLKGIIKGASHRYKLAFAISCGLDSRTLFSASREVSESIHYFTHARKSEVESNPDVSIPSAMLKKLGLKHSILVPPHGLEEEFESIFSRNVFTARKAKGLNAMSVYNQFKDADRQLLVIYGNCSEITKRDRFRFPITPAPIITGTVLAAMAFMRGSRIAVREFNKWLEPVKALTKYNLDILDLMHWEQRVGNWGAMSLAEYDMVSESLCPYSCRKYIEYMLSVPFKYRTNPEYELHHRIIAANWPDALEFEINPEPNGILKMGEEFLYRTGLYDPIKFLHIMLYKRFRSV